MSDLVITKGEAGERATLRVRRHQVHGELSSMREQAKAQSQGAFIAALCAELEARGLESIIAPPKQKPGPKPKPIQKAKPIQAQGVRQRRPSIRNANAAFLACEPVITADTKITRAEPFVDRRFVGETPPGWVGQITRDWRERRLGAAR